MDGGGGGGWLECLRCWWDQRADEWNGYIREIVRRGMCTIIPAVEEQQRNENKQVQKVANKKGGGGRRRRENTAAGFLGFEIDIWIIDNIAFHYVLTALHIKLPNLLRLSQCAQQPVLTTSIHISTSAAAAVTHPPSHHTTLFCWIFS